MFAVCVKIAYLHILPLEYYPPATNFLDILALEEHLHVRAYSTENQRERPPYKNAAVEIHRTRPPNPGALKIWRLLRVLGWHLKAAFSLSRFKPDTIIYIEPHSAIAAWLYFKLLRGKSRLFVHHHEYYEASDYQRRGMKLPGLGARFEQDYLFSRAEWISQTNKDRLRLAKSAHPNVSSEAWQTLPNYPPAAWGRSPETGRKRKERGDPLKIVYVGSASFEDTFIKNMVNWAAEHAGAVELHICGYNVAKDVWDWLQRLGFSNVTYDRNGFNYDDLPDLLRDFDVGLVLYKGNTTNFVFNVPNKVFEYLRCGLEVWYPKEMKGIDNFREGRDLPLRKIDFLSLTDLKPVLASRDRAWNSTEEFTAEQAFAPLFYQLKQGRPLSSRAQAGVKS